MRGTRLAQAAFWTMVATLGGAQIATLAMGFGAPIPTLPVIAAYLVGTVIMADIFATLIVTQIKDQRASAPIRGEMENG